MSEQNYLKNQLQQFGLNPSDWILEARGARYFVKNRNDRRIYFQGWAQKTLSNLKWKSLEVVL